MPNPHVISRTAFSNGGKFGEPFVIRQGHLSFTRKTSYIWLGMPKLLFRSLCSIKAFHKAIKKTRVSSGTPKPSPCKRTLGMGNRVVLGQIPWLPLWLWFMHWFYSLGFLSKEVIPELAQLSQVDLCAVPVSWKRASVRGQQIVISSFWALLLFPCSHLVQLSAIKLTVG